MKCPTFSHHFLFADLTSLFTCGGWDGSNSLADAEVIDLASLEGSNPDRTCTEVPDMPIGKGDLFAMWDYGDKSVLCCGGGGFNESLLHKQCSKYSGADWIDLGDILIHDRRWSAAVELSDGRYWISGGVE